MNVVYGLGQSLFRLFGREWLDLEVINRERLIEDGPALVVANHQSFLDPPFIGCEFRHPIYYLARKTLFKGRLAWLLPKWNCIPVDRDKPELASLKRVVELLKAGERVLAFPEGTRSADGTLGRAEAGVGFIVAKALVPVLPIRIFGASDALPRGAKALKRARVTVVVGEPMVFSAEDIARAGGKKGYQKIADCLMDAIGELSLDTAPHRSVPLP